MTPTLAPPLGSSLESLMYGLSQLFLIPVLLTIAVLFLYAFYALGAFSWQAWQRQRGRPAGFELLQVWRAAPQLSSAELEAEAVIRLEFVRIVTRVAPMLGLVATMIPMGPALKALGDGQLSDVANSLMVAFSAVILALIASAMTYAIANVRRRWYASDLMQVEKSAGVRP
jgi:biopolymer transport protein ExbB/TolQ